MLPVNIVMCGECVENAGADPAAAFGFSGFIVALQEGKSQLPPVLIGVGVRAFREARRTEGSDRRNAIAGIQKSDTMVSCNQTKIDL